MKLSVIYDSKTGNTAKMAECIVKGAQKTEGVEAKAFSISNIDQDFVKESKAVIFGSPTYNGSLSAAMKAWLETEPVKLNVAGKLGGAYATAAFVHGGADLAIQCILTHLMVDGMMVYSSGQAKGMPVIHLGPVAISDSLGAYTELFCLYGKRMAEQMTEIFS